MSGSEITTKVRDFIERHGKKSILRLSTVGSVDDGKSTLIGRLLYDTKSLAEDHLASLEKSTKIDVGEAPVDFALVTDGLEAERQQGITIDVAYRYFSTEKRNFIIADTPGHEQYTRNMATGASTANVAIILIDARHGVLQQTRRHSFIASLLGIPRLLIAVNKMDLVDYSEARFNEICEAYTEFARRLGIVDLKFIPISALVGDNVVHRSERMPWYKGEPVLEYLEEVYVDSDINVVDFRFPVQYVIRPDLDFRGYAGQVSSGRIRVGEEVLVLPSMRESKVARIVTYEGDVEEASAGESVTLVLEHEIDVSRGDMIVRTNNQPHIEDHFEAMLVWMSETPMDLRGRYILQHNTQRTKVDVTGLPYRVDVNTLSREEDVGNLELNQIGRIALRSRKPIFFDPYEKNRLTGSFILVDQHSHATVAAGMIIDRVPAHVLKDQDDQHKARNIHRHEGNVSRLEREARTKQRGLTLWFTGLSASGKSTIASTLERRLFDMGRLVYRLDGDNVRSGLNSDLGFSQTCRQENIRRVAEVAQLMNDAGLLVIAAVISPYTAERENAREIIGDSRFLEIHVNTPLEVCMERDPKGLYKKAKEGLIPNFTGVSDPYQEPENPALRLDTSTASNEECVQRVIELVHRSMQ